MAIINSSGAMLLGILVMSTIILAGSAPLSPYERRSVSGDRPKVYLLVDRRRAKVENDVSSTDNNFGLDPLRKKIGSLSITHNIDVLRQNFLNHLASLKTQQNQQQIDQNRRVLDDIGKRSNSDYALGANRTARSDSKTGRDRSAASNRIEWLSEDDPLYRESQEDRLSKMQANVFRLL